MMRLALWTLGGSLLIALCIWLLFGPPEADASSVFLVIARR
jgi:hypothetical protein